MPEIKPEYPEGANFAEMTLVRMLQDRRCWFDTMDIINAIYELRKKAKSMREEHDRHKDTGAVCSSEAPPPVE